MNKPEIMKLGTDEARITMLQNIGGPFGAVITKGNEIISIASNHVLEYNDPTAHAEITAIRNACKKLNTYDLTGCELYATGYPCPMCMSAIIWANIKKIYVAALPEEAEKIGFRDSYIYNFIKNNCKDETVMEINKLDDTEVKNLYNQYSKFKKVIY